jgi:hypothetical protein
VAVALAYGDDHSYPANSTRGGFAVLPSVSLDAPLGSNWTIHAGAVASTVRTPTYAVARASLGEISLAYADHHRVRAEIVAYTEGTAAPETVNRGFAASLGWELAPRLSLRAWALRDGDTTELPTAPAYPGGPFGRTPVASRFDRDLVWLTWDAPTRFDLLLRSHALEGNVRVPLGGRYALTTGSRVRPDRTREFSLGVVRH